MRLSLLSDSDRADDLLAADLLFRGISYPPDQVRTPVPLDLLPYEDRRLSLHVWRIFAKELPAMVLETCQLHDEDKTNPLRCKICDHL